MGDHNAACRTQLPHEHLIQKFGGYAEAERLVYGRPFPQGPTL